MVSIEGEGGIGKTRLIESWTAKVRAAGATVLWAAGQELTGAPPLQPILDALHEHVRRLEPADAERVLGTQDELVATLIRHGVLGEPSRAQRSALATWSIAGEGLTQTLLFGALAEVISRIGVAGPPVLVLDDAQWADHSTAAWVHYCIRKASGLRLLVILGRRPEEGPAYRPDRTITLGPLDVAATQALVGTKNATDLHRRTGGNPLFLVELSRSDGSELPPSIRAAMAERVGRAGDAAATVRAAATLGPEVDLDLLAAVLHRPAAELIDDLEEGVRRHMLVERPSGFAFPHQLIREALVDTTGLSRRALLHREAARWLSARPDAEPLDIAYHARQAGNLSLTAHALTDAARVAVQRLDHTTANQLLDEAITVEDSGDRRIQRAHARVLSARFSEALEDAEMAIAVGVGGTAYDAAATASYYLRDLDGVLSYAAEGARIATDPETAASCLALSGRVLHGLGDIRGADEQLTGATAINAEATRPIAETWRAWLLVHRGDPAAALHALPSRRRIEHSHIPLVTPNVHVAAGFAKAMLGRPAAALAEFDLVAEASARLRTDRYMARCDNFRAWVLRNIGDYAQANALNESAYEITQRQELPEPQMHALLDLADGRLRAGDLADAQTLLGRYRREFRPHVFAWRNEWRARLLESRWQLATGNPDAAEALATEVVRVAAQQDQARYETLARIVIAECMARRGERVDLDAVGPDILALQRVAPLEAWWLTAHAAIALGVDAWRALAADRVAALAAEAGKHAEVLRRAAGRVLTEHRGV